MKLSTGLILGVAALSLTGCGGGTSGGGGGSTPPPPSSSNSSLSNLTVSETFPTTAGTISGNRTPTNVVTGVTSAQGGIGSDVRLAYDHSAGTYTVIISQNGVTANTTFGPTESGSTGLVQKFVNGSETLYLLRPGGNGTTTGSGLDYVSYGGWQRLTSGPSSSQDFETTFFVYGVRTPAASMPTSGNATYSTIVDGYWTNPDGLFSLGGTVDVTANFLNSSVTGAFTLAGSRVPNGDLTPTFGTLTGTATISGNTFGGMVNGATGTASTYSGTWNGGFFGPSAEEVGGSFRLTEPGSTDNQAVGIFVGK